MKMISVREAAEKWGVTPRWVQDLCRRGEIPDVTRLGRAWMIPAEAPYPLTEGETEKSAPEMPRRSPFLDMTDLYHTPGEADRCAAALADHPMAAALFEAEIAYSRGEIDRVGEYANAFLADQSTFYAAVAGGMLLGMCAIWRGDAELWAEAKRHICEAPCVTDGDREILSLSLTAVNSAIHDSADYPDWFKRGIFEHLPADAHSAAKVFYVKHLFVSAFDLAAGRIALEGVAGLGLMRTLPYIIEPMIAEAMATRTVIPEIYLRVLCAIAYHNIGEEAYAAAQLDRAIALALPDRLYGIFAEHRRQLDTLLDERLALADPKALARVKELHKTLAAGWAELHQTVMARYVCMDLAPREREVAKLAAFGLTNRQIAERLHIAESTVKQAVRIAVYKSGVKDRDELASIL